MFESGCRPCSRACETLFEVQQVSVLHRPRHRRWRLCTRTAAMNSVVRSQWTMQHGTYGIIAKVLRRTIRVDIPEYDRVEYGPTLLQASGLWSAMASRGVQGASPIYSNTPITDFSCGSRSTEIGYQQDRGRQGAPTQMIQQRLLTAHCERLLIIRAAFEYVSTIDVDLSLNCSIN